MSRVSFFQEIKEISSHGVNNLPPHNKILCYIQKTPESLEDLRPDWLIDSEGEFEMFYAPFRWMPKKQAKVLLLGITPGWTQARIAWKELFDSSRTNMDLPPYTSKSSFGGAMRKILIHQLNDIGLNDCLGLPSCDELFSSKKDLANKASILYFPVFRKGKNYTGHSPKPLAHPILHKWVDLFLKDILEGSPDALIIPMGVSVEMVLKYALNKGILNERNCLWGFPHPSPANAHRYQIMVRNKDHLRARCIDFFSGRK